MNSPEAEQSFDYLIIGSGAAGSVVAARLAEANIASIGVIEAGGDNNRLMVNVPAGFVRNLGNPALMWQFNSVAGNNTGSRSVYLPQGKLLGGSTSINGLVYNRGQRQDFDHWASLGNTGWSYNEVLSYFRKSETFDAPESQYRGANGPLRIGRPAQSHPLCDRFIQTVAASTGAPAHNDYNGETQFGTGYYQRFIHHGRRENVADRFLKPALKTGNITILKATQATKILFDQNKAIGVEIHREGSTTRVYAKREVLLCGGTVNSTVLLQRSGVGSGDYLQSLNIPVVKNLPGVGENFQDHYFVRTATRLHNGIDSLNIQSRGLSLGKEIIKWFAGKASILSWTPSIAYAFLHSESVINGDTTGTIKPDLQFVFTHGSYRPGRVYELDQFPAVTCGFTQQRPYSIGSIKISSADIHDKPIVQPNYLVDERDQKIAITGVKIARSFMQSETFKDVCKREEVPGKNVVTDDEILQFARDTGNTGYHLCGSCKMGPESDPMAVVSPTLKVHGVDGLRVIDASVMPTVTSSNTCAATIMIAEKAADMIINPTQSHAPC